MGHEYQAVPNSETARYPITGMRVEDNGQGLHEAPAPRREANPEVATSIPGGKVRFLV